MLIDVPLKRVSGMLDEQAGARFAGYGSSGSEHGAATCLSGLVHAFLENGGAEEGTSACTNRTGGAESDRDDEDTADVDEDRDSCAAETVVRELLISPLDNDPFRVRLAADVSKAAEALAWMRHSSCGASALRRIVMVRLRAAGYNAGICKARWVASGGLSAGSYEYIDVVGPAAAASGMRYIVDLDFAAEFEVARATASYVCVLATIPRVAVAGEEAMGRAVRAAADAARRSLRSQGLHVPPWRKTRYMVAKWLGPYRRTTNPVPATVSSVSGADVKCRAVGFPEPLMALALQPPVRVDCNPTESSRRSATSFRRISLFA